MNFYISIISYSLAWALVYSVFQGLLIYTTVFMLFKAFPGLSARSKYLVSYSALGGMFGWFVYTWVSRCMALSAAASAVPTPGGGHLTYRTPIVHFAASAGANSRGLQQVINGMEQLFPYFLIVYVIGLAFMTTRFAINIAEAGKLRRDGRILQAEFNSITRYWKKRLGIKRDVSMFLTDRVNVPVMLGIMKPVILLPFATASYLSTEQVEAIILHELAHVKRNDYLFNILQTIIETILFFNPFVWATSTIIRREREHCCDDVVVACSGNPLPYAKALTVLESQRMEAANLSLAATGHKNKLLNRIKRIMEMKNNNTQYNRPAIIVSALIAIVLIIAALTPTFAQKVKVETSDTTKSKPVYKQKIVTVDGNGKRTEKTKISDKPIDKDEKILDEDVDVIVSMTDDDNGKRTKKIKKTITIEDTDLDKMAKDLAKASAEIKEAMAEMKDELSAVDWAKIKKDISEAVAELDKTINDPALHKKIQVEMRRELDNAEKELQKKTKEIRKSKKVIAEAHAGKGDNDNGGREVRFDNSEVEAMLEKMEGDGLINRSSIFRVEKNGNELYINGKRQPRAVYEKYKSYLPQKSAVIKGEKDVLNVNISD
jgi:bla regulator protein BlaR1